MTARLMLMLIVEVQNLRGVLRRASPTPLEAPAKEKGGKAKAAVEAAAKEKGGGKAKAAAAQSQEVPFNSALSAESFD